MSPTAAPTSSPTFPATNGRTKLVESVKSSNNVPDDVTDAQVVEVSAKAYCNTIENDLDTDKALENCRATSSEVTEEGRRLLASRRLARNLLVTVEMSYEIVNTQGTDPPVVSPTYLTNTVKTSSDEFDVAFTQAAADVGVPSLEPPATASIDSEGTATSTNPPAVQQASTGGGLSGGGIAGIAIGAVAFIGLVGIFANETRKRRNRDPSSDSDGGVDELAAYNEAKRKRTNPLKEFEVRGGGIEDMLTTWTSQRRAPAFRLSSSFSHLIPSVSSRLVANNEIQHAHFCDSCSYAQVALAKPEDIDFITSLDSQEDQAGATSRQSSTHTHPDNAGAKAADIDPMAELDALESQIKSGGGNATALAGGAVAMKGFAASKSSSFDADDTVGGSTAGAFDIETVYAPREFLRGAKRCRLAADYLSLVRYRLLPFLNPT